MTTPELSNLAGTAGLIAVLIWFCRAFLLRWEASQRDLVEALQGVLRENNELLTAVRTHLAGDTERLHRNHYAHDPHPATRKPVEAAH